MQQSSDFDNTGMVDAVPTDNGHSSDDMPEEAQTATAPRTAGPPSNRPSIDAALIQDGGAGFSPIMVMVRASQEPLDLFVRGKAAGGSVERGEQTRATLVRITFITNMANVVFVGLLTNHPDFFRCACAPLAAVKADWLRRDCRAFHPA